MSRIKRCETRQISARFPLPLAAKMDKLVAGKRLDYSDIIVSAVEMALAGIPDDGNLPTPAVSVINNPVGETLSPPKTLRVQPVLVKARYKVCTPETVIEAKSGDTGYSQCGYRRQGRYCTSLDGNKRPRRMHGCWLTVTQWNNLPVEEAALGDNPPYKGEKE